ncbi:MAG TPA: DUF5667 domain-containing protein [Candidatus Dormibacteraeota bacterium]|nr:DUF5667 domain-containing protein [Candidatus Dormibacteraeota bacterium]
MLSHATTRDWLIPYADGMLAADEQRRIDGHLTGCAACAGELREIRELNLLLVSLPPAPPVAFAPFWLKLQAVLPQRRTLRVPRFAIYRRAGLAFALATGVAVAVAGGALAAPGAMPDSPLFPVKQLEESIQLATAPASGKVSVQLSQANQRLLEARQMVASHKPLLAVESLRAFRVTLNEAAAELSKPVDPRRAQQELNRLQAGLDAVEKENAAKDDDDSAVRGLVVASVDDLDRIEHRDATVPPATLVIGTEATPDPTPAPRPQPVVKPTPRPQPSDEEHH